MFFKRGPTFENAYISLKLTRGWELVEGNHRTLVQFDNTSGRKRLSVSVLDINLPCNTSAKLHRAVEDVYKIRLEQERKLIGPDDPITASGVTEAAGRSIGFFCGHQRETRRLFAGYVYGAGRIIVTLYLEGFGPDPKEHSDCLVSILNQLKIKNAD